MAGDWRDDEGLPEKRPDHDGYDDAEGRSPVVVRRLLAAGSIVVAAIALIVVLVSAGGSDGGGRDEADHERPAKAKEKEPESPLVANATPGADWEPHTGPVPILEYHDFGQPPEGSEEPELYVGRTDFEKQLDWLEENEYEAVTLEQVQEAWDEGGKLPPKPIVLTFDVGYRPQFTFALPTLSDHGWAGVLNLQAEGSELYESNVEEMLATGWELASQATRGTLLTELGTEELSEEVTSSREILQEEFDAPVNNFSYPDGEFDESVVQAVAGAGYVGATTQNPGLAVKSEPFELARLEITSESHVGGLAEALRDAEAEGEAGEGEEAEVEGEAGETETESEEGL